LRIRSKMWVVEDNEVVFGDGRRRLLEILERTGSLNQAAKELKMSYRAAWGKVKARNGWVSRSWRPTPEDGPGAGPR